MCSVFVRNAENKRPSGHPAGVSVCRKILFGTLADCEKVWKTSNSRPSAYIGTVVRELRSKSKFLRSKLVFRLKSLEFQTFVNEIQREKIH